MTAGYGMPEGMPSFHQFRCEGKMPSLPCKPDPGLLGTPVSRQPARRRRYNRFPQPVKACIPTNHRGPDRCGPIDCAQEGCLSTDVWIFRCLLTTDD
jgi:hypothetical protein